MIPSRQSHLTVVLLGGLALSLLPAMASAQPLVAAVLPSSRSVQVGVPATAFATVINAGTSAALNCGITPLGNVPAVLSYQTTNPATNQPTGTANTPVSIAPGGLQTFVIAFTPTAPFEPTDVQLTFGCTNTPPAAVISGLDTLLLSASTSPVSDVIALAATLNNDGIVRVFPGGVGGVLAVATANVGTGESVAFSADTGSTPVPVGVSLCQTNPATGQCVTPPVSGPVFMSTGSTFTFGAFVSALGDIPFSPAVNRIFVRFKDAGGVTRGSTSVAVQTVLPSMGGTWAGGANFSQTQCLNPANNVTRAVSVTATLTDQANGQFVGGIAVTYPGNPSQSTQINLTGSVNFAGDVSGTLVFSTSVNGAVVLTGDGTFTGQLVGLNGLNLALTGQIRVGEACHIEGSGSMMR